jgi:hypothetical protein
MKSRQISILVLALMLVAATPVLAAGEFTVGKFIQELARVKNLNATDARIAVDSLRSVGVRIPEEIKLDQRLTEGDVVEISRAVGLRVSTNNPESPFTEEQVNSYLQAFSAELGLIGGDEDDPPSVRVPDFDPHSKGKAYAKGHRTTTEPP